MKTISDRLVWSLLAVTSLLGVGIILVSTGRGPGVGGDATVYLSTAQNLLKGTGLGMTEADGAFHFLSYYPPLFPISLTALGLVGMNLVTAARWLNALLYGLLVGLSGIVLGRASRSALTGLLAALALAVSPIAIPPFSWAMSEPLANFLGFLGLACLLWSLERKNGWGFLFVSSVLCGLSIITRYASLPFLAGGALGLLALSGASGKRRVLQAGAYLVVGLVPVGIWEIWDYLHSNSLASRSTAGGALNLVSKLGAFWADLRQALIGWLTPASWLDSILKNGLLQSLLALVLLGGVIIWTVWALRKQAGQNTTGLRRVLVLAGLFFGAYLAFILLTYLFVFPTIDVNQRILLPLHIALIWIVAALAGLTIQNPGFSRRAGVGIGLAAVLLCGWFGVRSALVVQQNYRDGLGYNSVAWQTSPTIAQIDKLPPGTALISNEPTAIIYLTGKTAFTLVEPRAATAETAFTRYGDGDLGNDRPQQVFKENGAALVMFNSALTDFQALYGDRAAERLQILVGGLKVGYTGQDGSIYYYPKPGQ